MKKRKFLPMFCLLILCMCIIGCSGDENEDNTTVSVQFTEYSLPDNCKWKDLTDRTLYCIDSSLEFGAIVSVEGGTLPNIDFEKYSLLVTRIYVPHTGYFVTTKLLKIGNKYKTEILYKSAPVQLTTPSIIESVVLVDKVPQNAVIESKIEEME